jgi:hypothetical protein
VYNEGIMTEYFPSAPVECNENNCTEYKSLNRETDEYLLDIARTAKEISPVALDIIAKRGLVHMLPNGYKVGFDHHKN